MRRHNYWYHDIKRLSSWISCLLYKSWTRTNLSLSKTDNLPPAQKHYFETRLLMWYAKKVGWDLHVNHYCYGTCDRKIGLTLVERIIAREEIRNLSGHDLDMARGTSTPVTHAIATNWTFLLLCGVSIVGANFYVILQTRKSPGKVRSVSKLLLTNQAVADLFVGFFFVPAVIIDDYFHVGFLPYIVCAVFFNSLFARCIIALDRYVSVARPLQYKCLMTVGRAKKALQRIVYLTVVLDLLPLTWLWAPPEKNLVASRCYKVILWLITLLALLGIISFYIVTFYRARMFIKAKIMLIKRNQVWFINVTNNAIKIYSTKQKRLTIQFAIVGISFVVTYLPILYINLVGPILQRRELASRTLICVSSYLFVLNSLFSPIIAVFFNNISKGR